jgi:SAM-dependent methyltransferase
MSPRAAWEKRAPDWVRWARSRELDDDFWHFHLPEFLRFVPLPGRLTVDVGCGEGRLGRVLTKAGHRVVGFDASVTSVRAAATHPQAHPVAVADAVRLPLPDAGADLAIAFMSLHDFDNLRAAVAEVASGPSLRCLDACHSRLPNVAAAQKPCSFRSTIAAGPRPARAGRDARPTPCRDWPRPC